MSDKQHMRMQEKVILRVGAKILIPYILLFAFYVQFLSLIHI